MDAHVGPYRDGHPLGARRSVLRRVPARAKMLALFGFGGVLSGIVEAFLRHAPEELAFVVVGSVLLAVAAIAYVFDRRAARSLRVVLYEGGLELVRPSGTTAIAWDQVKGIRSTPRSRALGGARRELALIVATGELHVLPRDLEAYELFSEAILKAIQPLLLARARATIAEGGACEFGPLRVDRHGLTHGGASLAWSDVHDVRAEQGLIVVAVGPSRRWAVVPMQKVPSHGVLVSLARARRRRADA